MHEPDNGYPNIEKMLERSKGKYIYGETNCSWLTTEMIGKLYETIPSAIYIHLVRDARKVISSWLNRKNAGKRETPIKGWNEFTHFEKLCQNWTYYNKLAEEYANVRIRLEDFVKMLPHRNIGLPHRKWTEDEENIFKRVCGKLNEKYGYK